MTDIKLIRSLRKIVLFREMSDDELMIIFKGAQKKTYEADGTIFDCGQAGGTLYLINSGSVKITLPIKRYDSREEAVSILREGDCFGELSFFDQNAHSAKAIATTDVELLEIDHDSYERIIKEDLELGFEMQKKIIQKVINLVREMNTRYSYRPFVE